MTESELRSLLPSRAFVMCYDTSYACATKDWLLHKFYPWFKTTRWNLGLSSWTRKNDCDRFAANFADYAQDSHSLTSQSDEGLAVGVFCYHAAAGAHAINFAIVENDELIFIEPQTGLQLNLSPQEISTCFFACA